MCMLGIKLRSSATSPRALTHGANSPAHTVLDITLVLVRDRTHVTLKLTRQLRQPCLPVPTSRVLGLQSGSLFPALSYDIFIQKNTVWLLLTTLCTEL